MAYAAGVDVGSTQTKAVIINERGEIVGRALTDTGANVIQAAMDSQGIALGFSHIVDHHIARGDLVRPLAASLTKGYVVCVVTPRGVRLGAGAQRFYDWRRTQS